MKITVLNSQTLADITIQEKGSIAAWFDVAIANNLGITDDVSTGQELNIEGKPFDIEIVNFYKDRAIKPATWVKIENETDSACNICKYFK